MLDLKSGITKTVDQGINAAASLAVGALTVIIALIVRNVRDGVDGVDRITADLIDSAVDGGNTGHLTAIIADGFDGLLGGETGGAGCH